MNTAVENKDNIQVNPQKIHLTNSSYDDYADQLNHVIDRVELRTSEKKNALHKEFNELSTSISEIQAAKSYFIDSKNLSVDTSEDTDKTTEMIDILSQYGITIPESSDLNETNKRDLLLRRLDDFIQTKQSDVHHLMSRTQDLNMLSRSLYDQIAKLRRNLNETNKNIVRKVGQA
jgi:hypothetical protein